MRSVQSVAFLFRRLIASAEFALQILGELVADVLSLGAHYPFTEGGQAADQGNIR